MNDNRDFKNLFLVAIGAMVLIFGGAYLGKPLDVTYEQGTFFAGIVGTLLIVYLIIMAIRINKKKNDESGKS
ncbi:unnamed protein product [marine sediment metagenome]|uniref:Uncharacterized protein n=1 Tax=marine sediment metagenome TaxID=412755 RepID=X0T1R4_9ZZZZ